MPFLSAPLTVRSGSVGNEVLLLQAQLNLAPLGGVPLALDKIFGPKTLARTIAFQRANRLTQDGIVGPKTWEPVLALVGGEPRASRLTCDNGNPVRLGDSNRVSVGNASRSGLVSAPGAGPPIVVNGVTVSPLVGSPHEALARSVYLGSLNYDRIFISSQSGLKSRAFTIAVPMLPLFPIPGLPLNGFIQVMNIGTSPTRDRLIHELGHVWQSQHHSDPLKYMANCVACQGKARAINEALAFFLPAIRRHGDFPEDFPMSAYAYRTGADFGTYGGEQIAQQLEKNEAPIMGHATGTAAGAVSAKNESSLAITNIKIEDRRDTGVKI